MNKSVLFPLALLALGACDAEVHQGKGAEMNAAAADAEGNGMSISVPGFAMKVDLPASVRSRTGIGSNNELFYPGAALSGLHVRGHEGGGVELRFATPDAQAKVLEWYRASARNGFTIDGEQSDGETVRLQGTENEGGGAFTLNLSPDGTGTKGVLTLADRTSR